MQLSNAIVTANGIARLSSLLEFTGNWRSIILVWSPRRRAAPVSEFYLHFAWQQPSQFQL